MTDWAARSTTSTDVVGTWSQWFGDYATAAAAKRYLTMEFTGPNVTDRACWPASEIREVDGRWQVRVAYAPPPITLSGPKEAK